MWTDLKALFLPLSLCNKKDLLRQAFFVTYSKAKTGELPLTKYGRIDIMISIPAVLNPLELNIKELTEMSKISVIGAGSVGATVANDLMVQGVASEIILYFPYFFD